jgi:hypothetical protein
MAMFRSIHLLSAVGMLAAAGCLSGSYDEGYKTSLERYRGDSEFQRLHKEPKDVADGRLTLRVPKRLKEEEKPDPKDRLCFLKDFPGFCITYKTETKKTETKETDTKKDVAEAQRPAVLSVGVVLDKESAVEDVKKRILDQVRKEKAFAKESWVAAPEAAGTGPAWSVLKLSGQQLFSASNAGISEIKNHEGETQIWVASDPDAKVAAVLEWRVPKELAAEVPLAELAGLVARTVEFKALAEQAKEDAQAKAGEQAKAAAP